MLITRVNPKCSLDSQPYHFPTSSSGLRWITSGSSMTSKLLRLLVIIYVAISLLYTTNYFIPQKITSRLARALRGNTVKKPESTANEDLIYWKPSYAIRPNAPPVPLSSDLFLSKAFAESHAYSVQDKDDFKIVPNYYRASGPINSEDITISTLVTQDRFPVFKQLVENYEGPISVTIHVPTNGNDTFKLLDALHKLYTSTPSMALRVDVHLALAHSRHARRFNAWRNAARFLARTEFIMMLDVDFFPCTDFRTRVLISMKTAVGTLLKSGTAALVVPAFEYVNPNEGNDADTFPRDKESLRKLVDERRVSMFHRTWIPGHNSTDYERFLRVAEPGEVYRVTNYQHAYEPYVIFRKDGSPWCDERFVGYGGNKAACLFEMHLSGVTFYVLSDDFLIHQSHTYAEDARRVERRYNRKIYADFREEMCLKYLIAFHAEGSLGSPRARNVREECKKIRGIARIAAQLIG